MKIPQLFRYKKFRAATARRPSAAAGMDFEDIPEPNMKLSRALLIVLLLHVVAVSGIIAFNAIKTRESSFVPAAPAQAENNAAYTTGTPVHAEVAKARPAVSAKQMAPHRPPRASRGAGVAYRNRGAATAARFGRARRTARRGHRLSPSARRLTTLRRPRPAAMTSVVRWP